MPVQFDKITEQKTSADRVLDEISGFKDVFNVFGDESNVYEEVFYAVMSYLYALSENSTYSYTLIGIERDKNINAVYYHFMMKDTLCLHCMKMCAEHTKKDIAVITFEPVTQMPKKATFNLNQVTRFVRLKGRFETHKLHLEIKFKFDGMTKIL